jgi:hypothetical protein
MTQEGGDPWFVLSDPMGDDITQAISYYSCVSGEGIHSLPIEPATPVLECLWEVPVIEGEPWLDSTFPHTLDQPPIKRQAFSVHVAIAVGKNSGPRNRESVSGDSEFGEEI